MELFVLIVPLSVTGKTIFPAHCPWTISSKHKITTNDGYVIYLYQTQKTDTPLNETDNENPKYNL